MCTVQQHAIDIAAHAMNFLSSDPAREWTCVELASRTPVIRPPSAWWCPEASMKEVLLGLWKGGGVACRRAKVNHYRLRPDLPPLPPGWFVSSRNRWWRDRFYVDPMIVIPDLFVGTGAAEMNVQIHERLVEVDRGSDVWAPWTLEVLYLAKRKIDRKANPWRYYR